MGYDLIENVHEYKTAGQKQSHVCTCSFRFDLYRNTKWQSPFSSWHR